jgi:hypothetical protein
MEWSPPALMVRPTPQAHVLSMRYCGFGSPAAKENQMEPVTIAIDLARRVSRFTLSDLRPARITVTTRFKKQPSPGLQCAVK